MAPKKAEKRKAEDVPDAEPATKEAKVEEDTSRDVEKDDKADARQTLKTPIGFNGVDTTLNVVSAMDGKVLMALTEGGMQYLIAGARASVGMKAGRYMYEVKIIEALNPAESATGAHGRVPQPRQLVRLGFSTAGSPLVLGDSEDGVYFDSEGNFGASKQKKKASQQFTRDQVIGVLLNLDPKSPHANTVSIFREGERIAEPQPLPENLHGKTLFPHIAFRNVTVQVNMGPTLFKPVSFKCRMLQGAAAADTVESQKPKGDTYEVVMPVAFPDEGTFDWLDDFLEKNPSYVELSDRKIQDWAASSGLAKPKGGFGASNDKPPFSYQLTGMDDMSIQRVIKAVAPTIPRNYVVMEVKSNLLKEDRAEILKRFGAPHFKKIAHVVMGEPKADYKAKVQSKMLQAKQDLSDSQWKLKKVEKERLKAVAKRQKELADMRKKAEEQRKKLLDDAKKKQEEEAAKKKAEEDAKKKAEGGEEAKKEGEEETTMEVDVKEEEKPEEKKEDEVKDEEVKEEEVKEEVEEDDGLGDEPPKVELTEEEMKLSFRPKLGSGDLAPAVLSKFFTGFTIPEKAEGFDDVRFEWENATKSKEYLRKWVLETKQTSRIEDLQPSKYFQDKMAAWQKQYVEWQAKQKTFKAVPAKKKEEEAKPDDAEDKEKKAAFDIFSVEDVNDMKDGEPLYANFGPEDWALLQLRYELHLLQDAFKKDVDDVDRVTIPEIHLAFYYNRYFKKTLSPTMFGLKTNSELVDLIKDTVTLSSEPQVLTSQLSEDVDTADIFVKYTEEARRERKRRSDAGDETAKLKFTPPPTVAPLAQTRLPVAGATPQQWPSQMAGFKGAMGGKGAMGMGAMMGGWGKGGKW